MALVVRNTFLSSLPSSSEMKPRARSAPPCPHLSASIEMDGDMCKDMQLDQQLRQLNKLISGRDAPDASNPVRRATEGSPKTSAGVAASSALPGPSANELDELRRKLGQACSARSGLSRPSSSNAVCALGHTPASRLGMSRAASSNAVSSMTQPRLRLSRPASSNSVSTLTSAVGHDMKSSLNTRANMGSNASLSTLAGSRGPSSESLCSMDEDFEDVVQVVILEPEEPKLNLPIFAAPPAHKSAEVVVVQHVPRKYTYDDLIAEFSALGFAAGTYDYLYLPTDSKSRSNGGFAFVSFVNSDLAAQCQRLLLGHTFSGPC